MIVARRIAHPLPERERATLIELGKAAVAARNLALKSDVETDEYRHLAVLEATLRRSLGVDVMEEEWEPKNSRKEKKQ